MANIENKDPKKDFKKRMVKALFSYTPVNSDELTLKINDVLEVIEETEEGWWKGILEGNIGMFPSNFVIELDGYPEEFNNKLMNELSPSKNISKAKNVIFLIQNKQDSKQGVMNSTNADAGDGSSSSKTAADPLPEKKLITAKKPPVDSAAPRLPPKPVREQAQVIFPYESQNEDELSLKEGDIITVLSKEIEDKGWWRGELNNKIGVFPDNFVKLIKAEEQKKPERPDKPPAVIASKNSLKSVSSDKGTSESSPKLEKKVLKTPPAKPPPPEIHKKEPERPHLPCPSKKPHPLQPVKKPTRSSLGPKLPPSPVVSAVRSSVSENGSPIPTSFPSSSEKTEESPKVESTIDKDDKHKKGLIFIILLLKNTPQGGSPSLANLHVFRVRRAVKEENGVLGIPLRSLWPTLLPYQREWWPGDTSVFPLAHASLWMGGRSEPTPVNRLVVPLFGVPEDALL
ncbi:SH3 domain-containing kinase-binding protein 1 [Trichonephila clavipes]|nr:SH3 domain-containing kinase-binding protein 1 [Trichonephila clavipes]